MKIRTFDTETNGLLPELDIIWSLVIRDETTMQVWSCAKARSERSGQRTYTPEGYLSIEEGLAILDDSDMIIGHNILKFDLAALEKVHGWKPKPVVILRDTMVMAPLIFPEIKFQYDMGKAKIGKFPGHLIGKHSLEAWGRRLGFWKGDYSHEIREELKAKHEALGLPKPTSAEIVKAQWGAWSVRMQDYCEQDIVVTGALWQRCMSKSYSEEAIQLETDFAEILASQEAHGFMFDVQKATALYMELQDAREDAGKALKEFFGSWWKDLGVERVKGTRRMKLVEHPDVTMPRYSDKTGKRLKDYVGPPLAEYEEGARFSRIKRIEFNPTSRDHIAERLISLYGWEPTEYTEKGKVQVDEVVMKALKYPPAKILMRYLMIDKRISQLAEGKQAWLKKEQGGRIYGRVNTVGAVTRRCTHSNPNVAQVPKVKLAKDGSVKYGEAGGWGYECRDLFTVAPGKKLVGADASGIELRCLAHYMAKFDDGAYVKLLLEGDVHSANQLAAGLPSRDNAKTFIYAFLYGAGDEKIGNIIGKGAQIGKKLKAQFLVQTPALKMLIERVKKTVLRNREAAKQGVTSAHRRRNINGYLIGLDKGRLQVRHQHASLNTLLQSAGALIMKKALILLDRALTARGLIRGRDYAYSANIHDEFQIEVTEEYADEVGQAAVDAIRRAGEAFGFRCPLDGEYKVGNTWAETH